MGLDDLPADGKPESRPPQCVLRTDLDEFLEKIAEPLPGDSLTGIFHQDLNLPCFIDDAHLNASSGGGEFHGVSKEVGHHAMNLIAVEEGVALFATDGIEHKAAAFRKREEITTDLLNRPGKILWGELHPHFSGLKT